MRHFINTTLDSNVRVWSIGRSGSTTSLEHFYLNSNAKVSRDVNENTTAFNKRIRDKAKDGYVEVAIIPSNIAEALTFIAEHSSEATIVKEAMKCQKTDPRKFIYPCSGQPKLNGVRSYILWSKRVVGTGMFEEIVEGPIAYSMGGLMYDIPHITKHMRKRDFMSDPNTGVTDLYYDGELYVHGEPVNVIKKRIPIENSKVRGTFCNCTLPSEPIRFYCFDIAKEDDEYESRKEIRYAKMRHTDSGIMTDSILNMDYIHKVCVHHLTVTPLVYVLDHRILNAAEAESFTNFCIANGFEGSVFRSPYNVYRFGKRPKDIIKVKRWYDTEVDIIDIIPKPKGRGCMFVCKNDINDHTFECVPVGSFDEQEAILANKALHIGKRCTVKFYERSGVKKTPWHANVLTIRDYE